MALLTHGLFTALHFVLISVVAAAYKEKFVAAGSLARMYYPALLFKGLMGLLLGMLYHYYYDGGDTIWLFEDARQLASLADRNLLLYLQGLWSDSPQEMPLHYTQHPRALFFAKLISPIAWFTKGNYWMTSVYCSVGSFFCSWYLCQTLVTHFQCVRAAVISFLFYPSAVFWGSGIIKECVAVSMISLMVALTLQQVRRPSTSQAKQGLRVMVLLCCGCVLWQLKYYYAAVLFPVLVSSAVLYPLRWPDVYKMAAILAGCGGLALLVSYGHPNLAFSRVLEALVATHNTVYTLSDPAHLIQYHELEPTWLQVGRNVPLALVSGLFRPLPGDGATLLQLLVAAENMLLLLAAVMALAGVVVGQVRWQEKELTGALLAYVFTLSVLLALSTPNFGTLMRYKAVYLPFLAYVCLLGCAPLWPLFRARSQRWRAQKT